MIEIGALKRRIEEGRDWVVVGPDGGLGDEEVPPQAGPATLLVSKATEAVKRVEEGRRIASSEDRRGFWAVEAFLLNRVVVAKLEEGEITAELLLETVGRAGFDWQVVERTSGS